MPGNNTSVNKMYKDLSLMTLILMWEKTNYDNKYNNQVKRMLEGSNYDGQNLEQRDFKLWEERAGSRFT